MDGETPIPSSSYLYLRSYLSWSIISTLLTKIALFLLTQLLRACLCILTHTPACIHAHTHKLPCFYAYRIKWFKGIGDKMQAFHISAIILLILVMKRHYYLKAVCQKWIGCLIPGHWTTICITNALRNRRLEGTIKILMDCQVQLSPSQSTMHFVQNSLWYMLRAYPICKTPTKLYDRLKTP